MRAEFKHHTSFRRALLSGVAGKRARQQPCMRACTAAHACAPVHLRACALHCNTATKTALGRHPLAPAGEVRRQLSISFSACSLPTFESRHSRPSVPAWARRRHWHPTAPTRACFVPASAPPVWHSQACSPGLSSAAAQLRQRCVRQWQLRGIRQRPVPPTLTPLPYCLRLLPQIRRARWPPQQQRRRWQSACSRLATARSTAPSRARCCARPSSSGRWLRAAAAAGWPCTGRRRRLTRPEPLRPGSWRTATCLAAWRCTVT